MAHRRVQGRENGAESFKRGEKKVWGGGATEDLTWSYRSLQGLLYIGKGGLELKCTVRQGRKNLKRDGIKGHPRKETYSRDPSPDRLEFLSCHPSDLQDPRTFPRCSRPTSSRYSVPAGFPGCMWYFLLFSIKHGPVP